MKERKYQEDWVNESRIDDRGKEKRVPVYRGPRFTLPEGESRKGLAAKALAAWAGYALPLLAYFLLDFPGSRVLYVFLPAALK